MAGFVVDGTDSFIGKLVDGGARASLFQATVNASKGEAPDGAEIAEFKFICKGIQIPTNTIGVTTVNYMGRAVKLPGNRTYEDLTTTVINDEGYAFRNQVESWMGKLNSHAGNVRASTHMAKLTGYTTTMFLNTYKKTGDSDGTGWQFMNCFPTSLDQIDVNWEPNDAIMEYSITWAYDYWTLTEEGGGF
jgi:hypothetical protein